MVIVEKNELFSVMREFNPWWETGAVPDSLPWKRSAFAELRDWIIDPPSRRAVLVTGARRVGKTTLLRQLIQKLLADGVSPRNILYLTLDHPLLKLSGIGNLLQIWRELQPNIQGMEFLFIDEVQNLTG